LKVDGRLPSVFDNGVTHNFISLRLRSSLNRTLCWKRKSQSCSYL